MESRRFKVKELMLFLEQKSKLYNKNETKWKMENPTHALREKNLVFQLKQELWIKDETS